MHKREYMKKAISTTLTAFICAGMMLAPAYAAGNTRENSVELLPNSNNGSMQANYLGNATDEETSGMRSAMEMLNRLNLTAWLMTDSFAASRIAAPDGEDMIIDASGNALVNNFEGLEKALANDSVRSIHLNHNIIIRKTLTIDRSVRIFAKQKTRLQLMPGMRDRHFLLQGTGLDVEMENIVFFGSSMGAGGGIYAGDETSHSSLKLSGCDFIGNTSLSTKEIAGQGGAISIDNSTAINMDLEITDCKFESNKAGLKNGNMGYGGAICISYAGCSLVVKDSIFTHNQSGQRGGAIAYYGSQKVDIQNSIFENNTSTEGGAISLVCAGGSDEPLDVLLDSNILNKNIANNGGASADHRSGSGGGLFIATDTAESRINVAIEAGEIQNNQSYNYGGGICLNANAGGSINASMGNGLILEKNSVDIMDGKGGGVAALGQESMVLSLHDVAICNNDAQYGGGVFVKGMPGQNAKLDIGEKCNIQSNKANYGGGVMLFENAQLSAAGDWTIQDNNARFSGGGLYVKDNSLAQLNDGSVKSNRAESGEGSSNRAGGGIYVCENSSAELSGCTLEGNGSESGGGIYTFGPVTASGCAIKGNTAVYGGGICVNKQGSIALNNTLLESNNAYVLFEGAGMTGGEGGAIYTSDPSYANVNAQGTTFKDNNAESGGYLLESAEYLDAGYISESTNTTPFQNIYNNFDINYTLGNIATLYSIKVEYYAGEEDSQPITERINRVFEGEEILSALVTTLGENWIELHRKDGYSEGYTRFDFDGTTHVNEDVSIKVVYKPLSNTANTTTEPEQQDDTQPTTEPLDPDGQPVPSMEDILPSAENMIGSFSEGNIPPSDELAMAVPAPLPVSQVNKHWGIANAIIAISSILAGFSMLGRITSRRRGLGMKAFSALLGMASALIFALTQNTSLPAQPFDRWTPILLAMMLVQLLLSVCVYYQGMVSKPKHKRKKRRRAESNRLTDAV